MPHPPDYDAVVVGSGPNGLAAAIAIAQAGRSVQVIEAKDTIGGGTRSAEVTLPGFLHDICSAIHSGEISPFFRALPLEAHGLEWVRPPAPLAHPLDDGTAVIMECSVEETGHYLGVDSRAYRNLMSPFVENWEQLLFEILGPLRIPPRYPIILGRYGLKALRSARGLANSQFRGERARAFFAGLSAHAIQPLERIPTAAFGLALGIFAHVTGWPVVKGGSQKIADSLACLLRSLGGDIVTGWEVRSINELPPAKAYLFDVTPRQLVSIAGDELSSTYRRQLIRYRYGPGVFKIDYALSGPVPWRAPECARTATVHLGGTMEEISASERTVWEGKPPEKPFVLFAQQSLFDASRSPDGMHTGWAYCHVPNGSTVDMTGRIESQIERFAPGFRDLILARSTMNAEQMGEYNANYFGGDINGGVQDLPQLFTRPTPRLNPYTTSNKKIYLCSSSTPPGGGVHGMCGYYAAQVALKRSL